MAVSSPPVRNDDQIMAALELANHVRMYRAQLKRDIGARKVDPRDVIAEPDDMVRTMQVYDVLLATPQVGRLKAVKILNRCGISPSRTLGGLSDRQREALVWGSWGMYPAPRKRAV
jgi:hypothetical protein